jgi:hypothetical protein
MMTCPSLPRFLAIAAATLAIAASFCAVAQSLSLAPANPTPLDTVTLKYVHTGCSDPQSLQVTQDANHITVSVDNEFIVDCGTISGFFEQFVVGKLPSGQYDVTLVVNPPAGSLGPSAMIGTLPLSVAMLPPTGSAHPHENYSGFWWNSGESGWALDASQFNEQLFLVWNTYGDDRNATWFVVPSGTWARDSSGALSYSGTLYRTMGPTWRGPFDPASVTITAAGTGTFRPYGSGRAVFEYVIDGVSGSKGIDRFAF